MEFSNDWDVMNRFDMILFMPHALLTRQFMLVLHYLCCGFLQLMSHFISALHPLLFFALFVSVYLAIIPHGMGLTFGGFKGKFVPCLFWYMISPLTYICVFSFFLSSSVSLVVHT